MTKKPVFLFLTGAAHRDIWMFEIARELKRRFPLEDYYFSHIVRNRHYLQSKGIPSERIFEVFPFTKDAKKLDAEYVAAAERKYGFRVWDLWEIARARVPSRSKISHSDVLLFFQHAIKKFEEMLKIKPDYLVCYGIASYFTALLHIMSKKKGVKILEMRYGQIENRFTINDNLKDQWPLLSKAHKRNQKLTKSETVMADKFIRKQINSPKIAVYERKQKKSIKQRLSRFWIWFKGVVVDRRMPRHFSPIIWKLRAKWLLWTGYFSKPDLNRKFIYYPLHMQPEVSTLITGKWFVDQVNLVSLIAKSIPADHLLYVKEHPHFFSNRNLSFYRQLKRLPNVRLISPYADGFQLVKRCNLIISIVGSSVFEGFFFRKPAIIFGDIFFEIFPGVVKVEKLHDLPATIESQMSANVKLEDLRKFTVALFQSTYEGLALLPDDCNHKCLEQSNIRKLVDGIVDYLKKV